jgi:hypothetical protein
LETLKQKLSTTEDMAIKDEHVRSRVFAELNMAIDTFRLAQGLPALGGY